MIGIIHNTTCMRNNWVQINLTTEIILQACVTVISREIYIKVTSENIPAVLILFRNIVYRLVIRQMTAWASKPVTTARNKRYTFSLVRDGAGHVCGLAQT